MYGNGDIMLPQPYVARGNEAFDEVLITVDQAAANARSSDVLHQSFLPVHAANNNKGGSRQSSGWCKQRASGILTPGTLIR